MPKATSSPLDSLPEEQRDALTEWLLNGVSYARARDLVQEEFGISTSSSSIGRFWKRHCTGHILQRRAHAAELASAMAEQAAALPDSFDEASLAALRQRVFEILIQPAAKPSDIRALTTLLLKVRDQQLAERRIAEQERQSRQARDTVGDTSLSAQDKENRLREIFALPPNPPNDSPPTGKTESKEGGSITETKHEKGGSPQP